VSGKVVREITQDELGPIRIGNNVSSYAWEGTDEFGDKLANGVYLYRVITKINGSRWSTGPRPATKPSGTSTASCTSCGKAVKSSSVRKQRNRFVRCFCFTRPTFNYAVFATYTINTYLKNTIRNCF
jgi:flagellar hook assembly protein FlgD